MQPKQSCVPFRLKLMFTRSLKLNILSLQNPLWNCWRYWNSFHYYPNQLDCSSLSNIWQRQAGKGEDGLATWQSPVSAAPSVAAVAVQSFRWFPFGFSEVAHSFGVLSWPLALIRSCSLKSLDEPLTAQWGFGAPHTPCLRRVLTGASDRRPGGCY